MKLKLEDIILPGLLILIILYLLKQRATAGAIVAPVAANDNTLANRLLLGLGTPRITPKNIVTVTGTVVGVAPHYAPDGDMVFALKPDPPNDNLVNAQNKSQPKMAGGLWCEGMCQKPNKSPHPWHVGDCLRGGPFPKFSLPSVGDKMRITGMYAIDHREGGHAEIHPITAMSKV